MFLPRALIVPVIIYLSNVVNDLIYSVQNLRHCYTCDKLL